jgi:DNA-binding response OmpR family regulator
MVPTLTSAILLIENEYNLRQSLQLILMHAGYTVKTLQSCLGAPDVLEKTEYNLIVLSLHNSDQHSHDQIAKIRALFPHIPIIVLAANEMTELEEESAGGAEVYLVKPVDPGLILARITDILTGQP